MHVFLATLLNLYFDFDELLLRIKDGGSSLLLGRIVDFANF